MVNTVILPQGLNFFFLQVLYLNQTLVQYYRYHVRQKLRIMRFNCLLLGKVTLDSLGILTYVGFVGWAILRAGWIRYQGYSA